MTTDECASLAIFDEKVLSTYGLYNKDVCGDFQEWLNGTVDAGKLYKSVDTRVVNEVKKNEISVDLDLLVGVITSKIKMTLSESQFLEFQKIDSYFTEKGVSPKSKLDKLTFNTMKQSLGNIALNSGLDINYFLQVKHSIKGSQITKYQVSEPMMKYKELLTTFKKEHVYVSTRKNILETSFNEYRDNGEYGKMNKYIIKRAAGKFSGKNWSKLNDSDKQESFKDYLQGIGKIDRLDFITNSYSNKELKYSSIKWNIS